MSLWNRDEFSAALEDCNRGNILLQASLVYHLLYWDEILVFTHEECLTRILIQDPMTGDVYKQVQSLAILGHDIGESSETSKCVSDGLGRLVNENLLLTMLPNRVFNKHLLHIEHVLLWRIERSPFSTLLIIADAD